MDFQQTLMAAATAPRGAAPAPPYTANAVDYDGSTIYLNKAADFTGNADSSFGSLSVWLRLDAGDNTTMGILGNAGAFLRVFRQNDNKFLVDLYAADGTTEYTYASSTTYLASSTWLNVLMSWDLNHVVTQKVSWMYVNDTSVGAAPTNDPALAMTVDYTRTSWGAAATNTGGTAPLNGCMAELWFAPGQYIDFSSSANRRKFITAGGKPVDLGSDGSTPTGTAPILYIKNAASSVGTNSGTGGNMTAQGSPVDCSTSPST